MHYKVFAKGGVGLFVFFFYKLLLANLISLGLITQLSDEVLVWYRGFTGFQS